MSTPRPKITIAIPTRERAQYLTHSIRTCLLDPSSLIEVLVLDNASNDNTREVVENINDERVRYLRSPSRLSMRDNFERGLNAANGEIIGFIGDDDGLLPATVSAVLDHFSRFDIDALTSSRAHYFWPDLLAGRRNMALLPRGKGSELLESRQSLRRVLRDGNYYNVPCLYHGFAKMDVVKKIIARQGRFFLSSQVDIYSSIALSTEGIRFAHSHSPLTINGGSSRSNGASHFGGGTNQEKSLWNAEDDLGFLSGFENFATVESLILESAIRHLSTDPSAYLNDIFDSGDLLNVIEYEKLMRLQKGQTSKQIDQFRLAAHTKIVPGSLGASISGKRSGRALRLMNSFLRNRPIDMESRGISNVADASIALDKIMNQEKISFFSKPFEQIQAALRLAKN